jgi:predicted ABC-class ATPase
MDDQRSAEDRVLDEALARARAAFADKSDEELLDEITDVVDAVRAARRRETPSPTSA